MLHLPAAGGIEYYAALPGKPPGAPVLTSTVVGSTVRLSWTASPAGGAPTGYTLYAGSLPGLYNLGAFNVGAATSFTATIANGTYYVAIVARNGFGPGPPSNEVTVQVGPPPCTVAPTAPGPLTVTTAGAAVSLAWGASPTAAAYIIDAGSQPGLTDVGSFPVSSATSIVVAAPNGIYFVRVRAASLCGISPPSNEVTVVVDGTVPMPAGPDRPRFNRRRQRGGDHLDATDRGWHSVGLSPRSRLQPGAGECRRAEHHRPGVRRRRRAAWHLLRARAGLERGRVDGTGVTFGR